MQFKHPELLWALLLLLIPIIIHLFQLRRFKKTPFTNVKFLQKIVSESRRSSTLKKWLLLFTRMCLLAGLIIAFAQPYFANKSAFKVKEMVVYLDDSFSMQLKSGSSTLLEDAVQNFIKAVPKDEKFSLFTNEKVFKKRSLKSIQNDLLMLTPTEKQLRLDEIILKANTLFSSDQSTEKSIVIISDFQQRMGSQINDSTSTISKHLVQMSAKNNTNIAIDSVYIDDQETENLELIALLSTTGIIERTAVSLFNGDKLIAKTSATFDVNKKAKLNFTLPKNEAIKGKIEISDAGLSYDNHLFFNIDTKEKIKVLAIGSADDNYLKRIFTADEFIFTTTPLKRLNYGELNDQNLIVLNELTELPAALTRSVKSFTKNKGNLIIIPANKIDINTYNSLISNYFSTKYLEAAPQERKITGISFSHPLFKNVFEKNVSNFQYPKVSQYFKIKTNAPNVLSYQDNTPFLFGSDGVFAFTASLSSENSNFKQSPLIVPTFYKMGAHSLKLPELYQYLDDTKQIDIPVKLEKDQILKVSKGEFEFIPQQKSFGNKVSLTFDNTLKSDGIYQVLENDTIHKNISFNFNRSESQLLYLDTNNLAASTTNESIPSLFQQMKADNSVNELWKWFLIFAVLFMLVEVLIQKYL